MAAGKINILATKKLPAQQKQLLLDANLSVEEADFISVTTKKFELPKVNDNLIFTSRYAVQSLLLHPKCNELKTHPVFCVGMKTEAFLQENGFNVAVSADYAEDLAEIISLVYPQESFTFFSGNLRRDILPETLKKNRIAFHEIEVYETQLTPHQAKGKPDGLLFFSPSAVESYLKQNKIKNEICFCLGETTAEALENHNIRHIAVAQQPSIEKVIAGVIEYYTK